MNCTPTPDRRARVPIHHIGVALGLMLAGTAHAAWDCPSLVAVTTADATVTSASMTNPPATIGGAAVAVPFCRVQAVARPSSDSEIKFEVWLPPTGDAWTGRMDAEYRAAVAAAEEDPAVRVMVVTGAGRGFCAGADSAGLEGMAGTGQYDSGLPSRPATPGYGNAALWVCRK